ncbi:MAG: tetratricopeptide repeat protein [bacterium]
MRIFGPVLALLLVSSVAVAQEMKHEHDATAPTTLMSGLSNLHHAVSTKNKEAQAFFDQGLRLTYAFHHEAAIASFTRAADLDPGLAMAYWGIAYDHGPNYNMPMDADHAEAAWDAIQKALELAPKANARDRDTIAALAKRYSNDPQADRAALDRDYAAAMKALAAKYPKDLDAATLYAESLMDLHPWQLWHADGTPEDRTLEIVSTLESVLKRDRNHIGANHYYIHAVEASRNPERALPAAKRLETLAPAAGHLVHMPAHIYMRVGNYMSAVRANVHGVHADESYFEDHPGKEMYTMYYGHNLHFLAIANAMAGRYADSKAAADKLADLAGPMVKDMPFVETFIPTPTLVLVKFHKWGDVLILPAPDKNLRITYAVWRFARGMAYAASGGIERAKAEQTAFANAVKAIPADSMSGLNKTSDIMAIAGGLLHAKIMMAGGDHDAAVVALQKSARLQDSLAYDEPPALFLPAWEALGGVLLKKGDYAAAEQAFREDLVRNPNNGRSLFGLYTALKAQGMNSAATQVHTQCKAAWKGADTSFTASDF